MCSIVTIYPLAGPHNLTLLNQLIAIRSSSGFSHLRPGAFHIALQTHKTQPRGLKKRRTKYRLGFAPSARREKFGHFSVVFCASVDYRERVFERNSHTATRMRTHPLTLASPASGSTGPSSSLCTRLCLTVAFPRLLLTGPCLPSSYFCLAGNLIRAKTNESSDWHSPTLTETNAAT